MISDAKPGHFNQTLGIIRALEKVYEVKLHRIETKLRFGFLRPLLKVVCNSRVVWLNRLLAPLVKLSYFPFVVPVDSADEASKNAPHLLISCGGQTLYLNVLLARRFKTRNFFLGSLRGVRPQLFTAVISGLSIPEVPNLVELELSPGLFDGHKAAKAGEAFIEQLDSAGQCADKKRLLWVMLVGGDGAGYSFKDSDISALEQVMLAASQQYGVQWLLTTSRRTSRQQEQRLRDFAQQHQSLFAYTVFYHHQPEAVVMAFLGAGARIFATEDSSSMISEAIISQKPLITLFPENPCPDDNYRRFLAKHRDKNRLISLPLKDAPVQLSTAVTAEFNPLEMLIDDQVLEQLQPYLP